MATLIDSNPHLRDDEERRRMTEENARESSMFEGARGLPRAESQTPRRVRAVNAEAKKEARGPKSSR